MQRKYQIIKREKERTIWSIIEECSMDDTFPIVHNDILEIPGGINTIEENIYPFQS